MQLSALSKINKTRRVNRYGDITKSHKYLCNIVHYNISYLYMRYALRKKKFVETDNAREHIISSTLS